MIPSSCQRPPQQQSEDSEGEIQDAFKKILFYAAENGMSPEGVDRIRNIFTENRHFFPIIL